LFLVAELGCNWNGNYAVAYELMRASKEVGFNAVKFAVFDKSHWSNYPQFPTLESNALDKNNIRVLSGMAKELGIEFFATPCYREAVKMLNPYVKRFKIRFADRWNLPIRLEIMATKKPCIISGAHPIMPENWMGVYCIPKYPTPTKDLNFSEMRKFDGFSSHSPQPFIMKYALRENLKYYEIHMVLNHSSEWIDDKVSFDFKQIKRIFKNYAKPIASDFGFNASTILQR